MDLFTDGARRAPRKFRSGRALVLAAVLLGLSSSVVVQPAAAATTMKVVIVVGPTEAGTGHDIADAKQLAASLALLA